MLEPELLDLVDDLVRRMPSGNGRSAAIRALVKRALATTGYRQSTPRENVALRELIHERIAQLHTVRSLGGLVPLPALRAEIGRLAPEASRAAVDAELFALEGAGRVQCLVAHAPASLDPEQRAAGIERPGRGFVFYVVPRRG